MSSPKKYLVLAKVETTQFTDATPVPATDCILVSNLNVTPLRVETQSRNLDRPYFGNSDLLAVMTEGVLEYDVEIAGSGAAGTAPKWGTLMKGCSFAETLTVSVSAAYNPVSSAFQYLTQYCYRDGVLYKFLGSHGSVSIAAAAKTIPHFHFKFTGKYTAVTDAVVPAATYTGFQQPRASIPAYTGALTWNSYAAKISAFAFDQKNDISHAVWMNNETVQPVGRLPDGSVTVEAVTIATHDYFSELLNGTTGAFSWAHGLTAGNIVTVAAPKAQLTSMQEANFSGALAYQCGMVFLPNTGNDEISITCT